MQKSSSMYKLIKKDLQNKVSARQIGGDLMVTELMIDSLLLKCFLFLSLIHKYLAI